MSANKKIHFSDLHLNSDGIETDLSSETEICARFNEQHIGNEILREILPDIQTDDRRYSGDHSFADLLDDLWQNNQKHTVLQADGGMGKTTLLLDAARLKSQQPILYIPLEWLAAQDLTIEKYICRILYKDETSCDRLYRMTSICRTQPDLILLLDGFNEAGEAKESGFGKEIRELAQYPGMQIVVTSREDVSERYDFGFVKSTVCELLDGQIQKVLTEEEWHLIQGKYTLYELLKTPMLLLMYRQVHPLMNCHRDSFLDWGDPIENPAQLIHNYFVAQEAVLLEKGDASGDYLVKAMRCIGYALPYIGYCFEKQNRMSIQRQEFHTVVEKAAEFANQCSYLHDTEKQLCRQYCVRDIPMVNSLDVEDYLIETMHLLLENDNSLISFPHQIYRDYLSAVWLSKMFRHDAEEMWNQRPIPKYLHGYLREMNGRYWNGIAAVLMENARNRKAKTINNLLENLFSVFPCTAEGGTPDFTDIDFTGARLPAYIAPDHRIAMKGAKISNVSLGLLNKKVKTNSSPEEGHCHIPEQGTARLKAAAISGDGKRAVTLSQQTIGVFRRVQQWDLEKKRCTGECFAGQGIVNIHLSETGEWIIGERDGSYRIWNWENGRNSFELNGTLISNQHGKLITQGNKVLYRNSENILEVFDLETREFSAIDNLCKNVCIADFLPNGELVVVGDNADKAILYSTRDGRKMSLNSEDAAVTGIYCMKAQPFVGLSTGNHKFCFYHTGTGKQSDVLDIASDNKIFTVHRSRDIVACSRGGYQFETFRHFSFKTDSGKTAGVWYQNRTDHKFYGDVLDMNFNEEKEELVTIMSDGMIVYSQEWRCNYRYSIRIITDINVDAYDFTGVLCSDEIRENLRRNGALV